MTIAMGKTDTELRSDIVAEMKFEPTVKITDIGVLVKHGVVTLNGIATSYGEKWHAVRAAKRVAGLKAIADNIEVRIHGSHRRTDAEIAAAAANQIDWSTNIPSGSTRVTVSDGWITLDGEVRWMYQKNAAEDVVTHMLGVQGVRNHITIKPSILATDIEIGIKSAFARNAILDAQKILVMASGTAVALHGNVRTHTERDEAERVAWAAPGVTSVDNQLKLAWQWG